MNLRRTATISGWLWIATFVTSIPAYFTFYAPMRNNPGLVTGSGPDPTFSIGVGAILELLLIIANVGTAVVFYPILKRQNHASALGYVGARLMECTFIAIGIIAALTFTFMRQSGMGTKELGNLLMAIYDRSFLVGPGFCTGFGSGLLLGVLLWRSRLVPRSITILGLVGGPLLMASGMAIMLGFIPRGGTIQGLSTIPEFIYELSLGIYLVVKGFRPSPITAGLESRA